MRLWSLHPSYLDSKGIVALWRESLLARSVLRGKTKGYRNHPQLERFRCHRSPVSAINNYLRAIAAEAADRGYHFEHSRIGPVRDDGLLTVTTGQLEFEVAHLRTKLLNRAPGELRRLPTNEKVMPHPLFVVREGLVESWEKTANR